VILEKDGRADEGLEEVRRVWPREVDLVRFVLQQRTEDLDQGSCGQDRRESTWIWSGMSIAIKWKKAELVLTRNYGNDN
jgi:hypothetical protein